MGFGLRKTRTTPTRANNYYPKGVIAMRRIIKLVVAAIIAAALVLFGAPAPASAEGAPAKPYSVKFIRDKNCANSGTFVIRGIPGTQRLLFTTGWDPDIGPPFSSVYGGFSYTGKGGTKPSVWRKHLAGPKVFWGKMPTKAFMLSGVFRTGRNSPIYDFTIVVPACKK